MWIWLLPQDSAELDTAEQGMAQLVSVGQESTGQDSVDGVLVTLAAWPTQVERGLGV